MSQQGNEFEDVEGNAMPTTFGQDGGDAFETDDGDVEGHSGPGHAPTEEDDDVEGHLRLDVQPPRGDEGGSDGLHV